ncbi:MAG: hypothetical protein JNK16_13895 [Phycisphaerales bacterium]|nr:hypothetical protein [Phycisphaerales bacterium]
MLRAGSVVSVLGAMAMAAIFAPPSANARQPSANEATVRRWLEEQLSQPPAIQRVRDLKISYVARDFPRMSKTEYESLVAESKRRRDPGDDLKLQLDAIPQRLGFDTIEHTVWWQGTGSWRFNSSYPNNEKTPYHDVSVTKSAAWQFTPQQLTVLDTARPAPNSYNLPSVEQQINSDLSQLIDAWLNDSLAGRPALASVALSGDAWSAELRGEKVSQQIRGRWDASLARGFVQSTVFTKTPHPDGSGLSIEYADWKPLPDSGGAWIAHRLVQRKPDGRMGRELMVTRIDRLDKHEFHSITQPPSATGSDPVRGKLTVTTVYDFGQGVRTSVDPETASQTQTGVLPRLADEEATWQRIGWFTLAGIVAILVGMRLFRFLRRA